jgi:hypothetical protein
LTPREFAKHVRERGHPCADVLGSLTDVYYSCRYASDGDKAQTERLAQLVETLSLKLIF